jgi:signal transduction histidine kinase
MPGGISSRGLLVGGMGLMLVALPLTVIPMLRDRADTARARSARNDEVPRASAAVDAAGQAPLPPLRARHAVMMNAVSASDDVSPQVDRALFAAAGICLAVGAVMLLAHRRRQAGVELALRAGLDTALAASRLKSRSIAAAAHDLRQPLHAISMYIGVLRRRAADPATREVVENMAIAVASMQRMFAALLDVARLDAGAIQPAPRQVRLQELYDALEVELAPVAVAKGLSLDIVPTTLAVTCDPALLETILRNLLGNAVKFCDSGTAGIATRRQGDMVEVTVFDTGIGIAPDDQRRIFEQFERGALPGPPRDGLGLGLSIVRRMAELLGTRVELVSRAGEGSRFSLALPHAPAESQCPAPDHRR